MAYAMYSILEHLAVVMTPLPFGLRLLDFMR